MDKFLTITYLAMSLFGRLQMIVLPFKCVYLCDFNVQIMDSNFQVF